MFLRVFNNPLVRSGFTSTCRFFSSTQINNYFPNGQSGFNLLNVEKINNVAHIRLNRVKAHNALNDKIIAELGSIFSKLDTDNDIKAIVLGGASASFAAGADIREMADKSYMDLFYANKFENWDKLTSIRTPIVAAVSGYALGGGCELAMMCDIILASSKAKFGLPEITIGTIPGSGGTQRLTRAIGKSRAMEMILTGKQITAEEADKYGLVSRVVPEEELDSEAITLASKIASHSGAMSRMAKQCVDAAYETTLQQGVAYERAVFYSTFATADQKEGMGAFVEKRKPQWQDK